MQLKLKMVTFFWVDPIKNKFLELKKAMEESKKKKPKAIKENKKVG